MVEFFEMQFCRKNRLVVPRGNYYLVDRGYLHGEGFLAPFRGQRYHQSAWNSEHQPTTAKEYFNMKHSCAKNVIERSFYLLKRRWAILRSPSFYPVGVQNMIIVACLLHNFIRTELSTDPLEEELGEVYVEGEGEDESNESDHVETITSIVTSTQWSQIRANLATNMYNN